MEFGLNLGWKIAICDLEHNSDNVDIFRNSSLACVIRGNEHARYGRYSIKWRIVNIEIYWYVSSNFLLFPRMNLSRKEFVGKYMFSFMYFLLIF